MPTIRVAKAFNLLRDHGQGRVRFEPGEHEVESDIASHWYTRQHLEGAPGLEQVQIETPTPFVDEVEEEAPAAVETEAETPAASEDPPKPAPKAKPAARAKPAAKKPAKRAPKKA